MIAPCVYSPFPANRVCLPCKGWWPSLPRVKAVQLRWAKANTGAGLRVVTMEGRAFGNVSSVLRVPSSACPHHHHVAFRERTSGCGLHIPKLPWRKHPASVDLVPRCVPTAGAVWVCTGDPLHPPKKIFHAVSGRGHTCGGSHTSGHVDKTGVEREGGHSCCQGLRGRTG